MKESIWHIILTLQPPVEKALFMSGWAKVLKGFEESKVADKPFHIAMIGFCDEDSCQKAGDKKFFHDKNLQNLH